MSDVLNEPACSGPVEYLPTLTIREREIFDCLSAGKPHKVIARELGVSSRTIEQHKMNIKKKLHFDDSGKFVAFAARYSQRESDAIIAESVSAEAAALIRAAASREECDR